eukprot:8776950-Alexandrium_andersonii.AAC.1
MAEQALAQLASRGELGWAAAPPCIVFYSMSQPKAQEVWEIRAQRAAWCWAEECSEDRPDP